jgi:hypothetical protein
MATCVFTDSQCAGLNVVTETLSRDRQIGRIMAALELASGPLPNVDDETLSRYYEYLSANLAFPFTAHYPEPANSREETEFRCTVLELLDPSEYLGDMFDGVFSKTRKGKYEINLPLTELAVARDSPNFQSIDDFRCWLRNWR